MNPLTAGQGAGRRVLLVGPPGSGKIALARRMAAALPAPDHRTAVERAGILDAAYASSNEPMDERMLAAFRAPHHTVSEAGLVGGGGTRVRPGEASLAHGGCLVLDEIAEFRRSAIEALGYALRNGVARHIRGGHEVVFPARPALVVACANVCPCGRRGTEGGIARLACTCSPESLARWSARLVEFCDALGITEIVALHYKTTAELLASAKETSS